MFIDKVRVAQEAGAIGMVVIDRGSQPDKNALLFTMSGDGVDDVTIPSAFVYGNTWGKFVDGLLPNGGLDQAVLTMYGSLWNETG